MSRASFECPLIDAAEAMNAVGGKENYWSHIRTVPAVLNSRGFWSLLGQQDNAYKEGLYVDHAGTGRDHCGSQFTVRKGSISSELRHPPLAIPEGFNVQ